MNTTFKNLREIARKQYNDSNCSYGDGEYMIHIDMVSDFLFNHIAVFKTLNDAENTLNASLFHDSMEDAKQTYNDICMVAGKDVADITLGVTDVPAENRLMKHLLTMGKTVRDYRAIILKMADMYSNAKYSKQSGSTMYVKYVAEYRYRKPIFEMALSWYKNDLNQEVLAVIWKELDEIHTPDNFVLKTI
jgi:(p)ppGpp synthase/HD superfamily hydrolase